MFKDKRLTINSGQDNVRLRCESRAGNPPAILKWYVDNEELDAIAEVRNETGFQSDKTWNVVSVVQVVFRKVSHEQNQDLGRKWQPCLIFQEDNNKTLKCRASHPAYTGGIRETGTTLDVRYAPIVRLQRAQSNFGDLEADVDDLKIECEVDANPRGNIMWRKAGEAQTIFRFKRKMNEASGYHFHFLHQVRIHLGLQPCPSRRWRDVLLLRRQ